MAETAFSAYLNVNEVRGVVDSVGNTGGGVKRLGAGTYRNPENDRIAVWMKKIENTAKIFIS
jgi:hypothetical protein